MSQLTQQIHELFAQVLHLTDAFDDDTPFIELGGQSILMGELKSRMEQMFQVDIPFDVMFAQGTVSGLAAGADTAPAWCCPGQSAAKRRPAGIKAVPFQIPSPRITPGIPGKRIPPGFDGTLIGRHPPPVQQLSYTGFAWTGQKDPAAALDGAGRYPAHAG